MDYIKTLKKQYKNIEPDELFNMIKKIYTILLIQKKNIHTKLLNQIMIKIKLIN